MKKKMSLKLRWKQKQLLKNKSRMSLELLLRECKLTGLKLINSSTKNTKIDCLNIEKL